ncbi:hypothetical protein OROMI_017276 [Orobanche minor]
MDFRLVSGEIKSRCSGSIDFNEGDLEIDWAEMECGCGVVEHVFRWQGEFSGVGSRCRWSGLRYDEVRRVGFPTIRKFKCANSNNSEGVHHSALVKVVDKLPQLQELHLIVPNRLITTEFKSIGTYCRNLSSFTYHHYWDIESREIAEGPNDHATAIAESLSNLFHLRLITDSIEDERLKVILEKCIHLESLDIRDCSDLRLKGISIRSSSPSTSSSSISSSESDGWIDHPSEFRSSVESLESPKFLILWHLLRIHFQTKIGAASNVERFEVDTLLKNRFQPLVFYRICNQ